jgi:uncharacterized protein (DUF2267 family)
MRTETFYRRVSLESHRESGDEAKRATAAVLQALRDRLTPEEADQAAAQLPRELKALWAAGEQPGRRPTKLHRDAFYRRVMAGGGLESMKEARAVTRAVFAALKVQISPGEADDVLAQLPRDLKAVWEDA